MTEKQIQKYINFNYDIWKYATKGMKEFNCTSCGLCCQTKAIELLPEEYQVLRKKHPKKKFVKISLGDNHFIPAIKPPCPNFNTSNNTCNIYKDRPFACWIFPMTIHTGKFPQGIQFMVNQTCPDIVEGEQYNFSRTEYIWVVTKLFSLASLDDNPTWKNLRQEIKNLPTYTPKKIPSPTFTWCSVCKRPFKKAANHQHQAPTTIQKKIKYISNLGQKFVQKKRLFQAIIYKHLNKFSKPQSLPEGGMRWKKTK